jgi:hypothetical protein
MRLKDNEMTLIDKLVDIGAIDLDTAKEIGAIE